jgi:hypothetical protein
VNSRAHSALGHKKVVKEGIVCKCDVIRICVRYYEIYVLELCHTFAADLYSELFEPTPLGIAQNTVWFSS